MKTAVVSLNSQGDSIGEELTSSLEADLFSKSSMEDFSLMELSQKLMEHYEGIIFIASTGIAVRAIAPFIKHKGEDPAVVVIDCMGRYAISLLSGHLGGANELAEKAAAIIHAQPIITTATDLLGVTAPDMIAKNHGLGLYDYKAAKNIAALLVEGKKVAFVDENDKLKSPTGYAEDLQGAEGIVIVTNMSRYHEASDYNNIPHRLYLIRKNIVLGIGCRKDYPEEKMRSTVLELLRQHNIYFEAVKAVATVEIKKDEKAIIALAKYLKADFKVFAKEDIKRIHHKYPGSDFVEKSIGVRAVCEPCVELSGARLLTEKISCQGMTVCIGEEA